MSNNYYVFESVNEFVPGTRVRSDDMNRELNAIQAGFDLLPPVASAINRNIPTLATETQGATVNDYTVDMPVTRLSNQEGDEVVFRATHTNTGAATLQVDALTAVPLVGLDGAAFTGGEIVSGLMYIARYDNTNSRFALTHADQADVTNAAAQVSYAEEWANKAEDSLVSTAAGGDGVDDFSALHWANKAAASASAASSSETNAATSETNAAASAAAAAASASAIVDNVYYAGLADVSVSLPAAPPGDDHPLYRISVGGTHASTGAVVPGDYILWDGTNYQRLGGGSTFYSDDAGAAAGPVIVLDRDSASPATNDVLGQILFRGSNSVGNNLDYASIQAVIATPGPFSDGGHLTFSTEGNFGLIEQMRLTNAGHLGIGTSTPGTELEVDGTASAVAFRTEAWLEHDGDTNSRLGFPADNTIAFETTGFERMRIDSGGNVSIGTTAALNTLTVQGSGIAAISTAGPGSVEHGRAAVIGNNNELGRSRFEGYTVGTTWAVGAEVSARGDAAWSAGSAPTRLEFLTTPAASTTPAVRMTIKADGNVGINTTNPSETLHVVGTALFGGNFAGGLPNTDLSVLSTGLTRVSVGSSDGAGAADVAFYSGTLTTDLVGTVGYSQSNDAITIDFGRNSHNDIVFDAAGTERMRLTNAGNLGLGTDNPAQKLSIASSTAVATYLGVEAAASLERLRVGYLHTDTPSASDTFALIGANSAGDLVIANRGNVSEDMIFYTAGSERMRLTNAGNLGIGISSPDGRLHVHAGPAGAVTAGAAANELVLENSDVAGMSILTPNDSIASIFFGDQDDSFVGGFRYFHANDELSIYAGNAERLRLEDGGDLLGDAATFNRIYSKGTSGAWGTGYNVIWDGNATPNHAATGTVAGIGYYQNANIRFYAGDSQAAGQPAPEVARFVSQGTLVIGSTNTSGTRLGLYDSVNSRLVYMRGLSHGLRMGSNTNGFYIDGVDPNGGSTTFERLNIRGSEVRIGNDDNADVLTVADGNGGRVGILTASPTTELQIGSGGAGDSNTITIGKGFDVASGIEWLRSGIVDARIQVTSGESLVLEYDASGLGFPVLAFQQQGTEVGRFHTNGFFGIATNNPVAPIEVHTSSQEGVRIVSEDAGAGAGPFLTLLRDSASPAANDVLAKIRWLGNDSIATVTEYASIDGIIESPSHTGENGAIRINTTRAGSSVERMRIDSLGNVGINTTAPSALLNAVGQQSDDDVVRIEGAGSNFNLEVRTGDASVVNSSMYSLRMHRTTENNCSIEFCRGTAGGNGYLVFTTNTGIERMRLDPAGRLGIGTSSPSGILHVEGASIFDSVSGGAPIRLVGRSGGDNAAFIDFYEDGNTTAMGRIGITGSSAANAALRFSITSLSDEAMRIQPTGHVGIGTTNPDGRLHVQDGSAGTVNASAAARTLVVEGDNAGGVGISILTPSTGNGNIFFGNQTDEFVGGFRYYHSTHHMSFHTNNAEQMRLDDSGNLGIGTTSPDGPLHVQDGSAGTVTALPAADTIVVEGSNTNGVGISILTPNAGSGNLFFGDEADAFVGGFRYFHSTDDLTITAGNAERMRIDSSGNVGINRTNPTFRLDVQGTVRFDGIAAHTGIVPNGADDGYMVIEDHEVKRVQRQELVIPQRNISANTNLADSDANTHIILTGATNRSLTVNLNVCENGSVVIVSCSGSAQLQVTAGFGVSFVSTGPSIGSTVPAGGTAVLIRLANNSWVLSGDLV